MIGVVQHAFATLLSVSSIVVIQLLSQVRLFATPWTAARPSFTFSLSLLGLMSIESVMPSNHLILCCPLLLPPSIFPQIRVFFPMSRLLASGGQSIGASVSASVLPMNIQGWFPLGWTGLISLQSKRLSRVFNSTTVWRLSILCHSAFFIVQLSHLYVTTGNTIALTIWTFVGKVMFLFFNTLYLSLLLFQGASVL